MPDARRETACKGHETKLIKDRNELRAVLRKKFPHHRGQLLPALHFLQHEFGYLPDWGMEVVGWHLGIPASEVYGTATSYTELRTEEPGEHVVRVCTGLGCRINGGDELSATVVKELDVQAGETTPDGRITFEETDCGFLCAMAPAVELDGKWVGRATPEMVKQLIR